MKKRKKQAETERMSVGETARYTGLSRIRIYILVRAGELALHSWIDGKYMPELRLRLYRREVDEWLRRQDPARLRRFRDPVP